MSETVTEPSIYEPLSEATENDVREPLPENVEGGTPPEAPETPAEPEAPVEPTEATSEPETEDDEKARNARLAKMLREEKRRARQLEQQAQVLAGQRQETRDETVEREVQMRAAQMAHQQQVNAKANEIYQNGVKEFGAVQFQESVQAVNEAFGQQMMVVIDTLTEIDGAQKLINWLADNPDLAENYAALPPHKLGAALARQAEKLNAPKPKPLSKAPAPVTPIRQVSSVEPETDLEKMSMEELDRMWTKRDWEKRMGLR